MIVTGTAFFSTLKIFAFCPHSFSNTAHNNIRYFPTQHHPTNLCNRDRLRSVWDGDEFAVFELNFHLKNLIVFSIASQVGEYFFDYLTTPFQLHWLKLSKRPVTLVAPLRWTTSKKEFLPTIKNLHITVLWDVIPCSLVEAVDLPVEPATSSFSVTNCHTIRWNFSKKSNPFSDTAY